MPQIKKYRPTASLKIFGQIKTKSPKIIAKIAEIVKLISIAIIYSNN
jgi:hypothetical protein